MTYRHTLSICVISTLFALVFLLLGCSGGNNGNENEPTDPVAFQLGASRLNDARFRLQ